MHTGYSPITLKQLGMTVMRICSQRGRNKRSLVINNMNVCVLVEQIFIASFTQKQTWVGLNDIEQEGTWKWVDGTPLTLQ